MIGIPEYRQLDAETALKVMEWKWIEHTEWEEIHGRTVCIGGDRLKYPGGCPWIHETLPAFSENMEEAWRVLQKAHGWIFSKRKAFMTQLQIIVSNRVVMQSFLTMSPVDTGNGLIAAWPDVMWHVEPADICLAAIHVVDSLKPVIGTKEQEKPSGE